jgi:hypothetical protein
VDTQKCVDRKYCLYELAFRQAQKREKIPERAAALMMDGRDESNDGGGEAARCPRRIGQFSLTRDEGEKVELNDFFTPRLIRKRAGKRDFL